MSATMTLPEQADGLGKLLALVSLRKEDVIATQTAVREQMQLTNEELGKVAQAKEYIARYESLSAELKGREDALVSGIETHNKAVEDFAEHVASENIRLETFAATLSEKEKAQVDVDVRQTAQEKTLATIKAENDRQNQEAMVSLKTAETANASVAKINEEERQRLQTWEDTLKRKADIARQSMAAF